MNFPFFPESASTFAPRVDGLYFALLGICGVVLLGILFVMVYFLFKYRRGHPSPRPPRTVPTLPFELTWSLIPLFIFMGFFVWGAEVYHDMQQVPENALEIHVVGKQWMWKLQHPTGQREIDELHVPVGRPIKLTMASQDVIHSFYIPGFRIKQDVVPGRYTTQWFHSTRPGRYHLFCAEYCGKDHSRMTGWVHVMEPADYEAWLVSSQPPEPVGASGARLFREFGCSGCHMGSRVVRAPPLEGLYGRPVALMNNQVVPADEKYIHDSILYPKLQITAGYEPVMPSYEGHITEEEIFDLVTYIKSLANQATPAGRPSQP